MRISLLRFFKTFQKYFLYLANAILGLKIELMQFYGLFILLLRSLARNLANKIFG